MVELLTWLAGIDKALFFFINQTLANPVTDFIMPIATSDTNLKIFYGMIVIFVLWKGDNRLRFALIFSALTIAISDQTSSHFLKPLIGRPRPCHEMEVRLLVDCGGGLSMPSSHAANLFAQAFFFWRVAPKSARILMPAAFIGAISRPFVGVHYPFDTLVGTVVGAASGFAGYGLFLLGEKHIWKKFASRNGNRKASENFGEGKMSDIIIKINFSQGDITTADTEAIVNAANNHLWMGSGVAGAIKRAGGEEIEKEAVAKGPIEVGAAVATGAGRLPYKAVLHAAAMGQDLQTNRNRVKTTTLNTLKLADKEGLSSIAFPALGTGVGGLAPKECALAMLEAVDESSSSLENIRQIEFVLFDGAMLEIFRAEYDQR